MAGTPSSRISGWAQWWPARMQTPSRSQSSAMSCGCMPSMRERDHAAAAVGVGRAEEAEALDLGQALERVAR